MWPPLDDPVQFEALCIDLWSETWGPGSTAQKNGRSGQPQAGTSARWKAALFIGFERFEQVPAAFR